MAERLAHTTKGVAGNIGADQVQDLAAEVERAIKERAPLSKVAALLDGLEVPLGSLVAALERALPVGADPARIAVDRVRLEAVCTRLGALLADNDSEAGDVWDENADLLYAAYPDHYARMDNAIRAFEFEAAGAALRAAAAMAP